MASVVPGQRLGCDGFDPAFQHLAFLNHAILDHLPDPRADARVVIIVNHRLALPDRHHAQ
jgi:hypothetical protein